VSKSRDPIGHGLCHLLDEQWDAIGSLDDIRPTQSASNSGRNVSDKSDPEVLHVLGRQTRQGRIVDPILAEYGLILFEAKLPQPTSDIHGLRPCSRTEP
jgi:hypothetical protein